MKHERDAIGPIIAQWLAAGVIEYVAPNDTQPLCILRCHGVPKSSAPWVRLVTDARPINGIFAKWPVRYDSIEAVRHLFARCSFGLTFDLKEAYAGRGQDMQRLPASSLYHEFLSDSSAGILVVTFDASPSGYAALIRTSTLCPPGR